MAGLQEQVRQLEGVNEDMLEETSRYMIRAIFFIKSRTNFGQDRQNAI